MMKFIEPFIDIKMQVAQYLYINRGNLDQKRLCDELNISSSTLKRTIAEVELLYTEFYYNGSFYNSHSLIRIVKKFISESSRLSLLKILILHPGESASFYKQHLLLSDATFSRTLQQLKKELIKYNIQIKVASGYWIVAKNEIEWIMFASYLASSFFWDREELKQLVVDQDTSELPRLEFTKYAFSDQPIVKIFYTNFYYFSLLYQYHQRAQKSILKEIDYTLGEQYLDKAERTITNQYRDRISHTVHTVLHDSMEVEKRERLISLLCTTAFYIELFPYKVETVDLRQDYFVRKMSYLHPEREQILSEFISKMNRLIPISFNLRHMSLLYFLTSESLFTFEKQENFELLVYSSLGKSHREFLVKNLKPLEFFYPSLFNIREIQKKEEVYKNKNTILLTNQAFDSFPVDNQYVVSDYLTTRDFLQFNLWLKQRISYTIPATL